MLLGWTGGSRTESRGLCRRGAAGGRARGARRGGARRGAEGQGGARRPSGVHPASPVPEPEAGDHPHDAVAVHDQRLRREGLHDLSPHQKPALQPAPAPRRVQEGLPEVELAVTPADEVPPERPELSLR